MLKSKMYDASCSLVLCVSVNDDGDMDAISPASSVGREPLSITSADSEFDESLAVPPSLAIGTSATFKENIYPSHSEQTDGKGLKMILSHIIS